MLHQFESDNDELPASQDAQDAYTQSDTQIEA
jgi:hypothetical protein